MKVALSTEPAGEKLVEYIQEIEQDADFLHCDVMDGKFVERERFSLELLKQANANTSLPLDVHLMVKNPIEYIDEYAQNGANIITIHFESFDSPNQIIKAIKRIKRRNCLVGLSLNPDTFIDRLVPFFEMIDLLLIMSVVPGKSGQSFIKETFDKIKTVNKYRKYNDYKFFVEVDGGVNDTNIEELKKLNVDIVVSGNYVYSSSNRQQAINSLK